MCRLSRIGRRGAEHPEKKIDIMAGFGKKGGCGG
jgi:hypothetical protein